MKYVVTHINIIGALIQQYSFKTDNQQGFYKYLIADPKRSAIKYLLTVTVKWYHQ